MKNGFTLIELVIGIVIAGIILVPTSFVIVESLRNTFLPEHLTVASGLLEARIEALSNLRFAEVASEGPLSFAGIFSDYSWETQVDYVLASDLNTAIEGPSDYKKVRLKILRPGFPDVSATTLITSN